VSGSPARRPGVEDLVSAYRADPVAAGMFAGHPVTSVARMFFTRVGAAGWAQMPLADQCALPLKDREAARLPGGIGARPVMACWRLG